MTIRFHKRRCSTCGKRILTFNGLMRHYLTAHPAAVDATHRSRAKAS